MNPAQWELFKYLMRIQDSPYLMAISFKATGPRYSILVPFHPTRTFPDLPMCAELYHEICVDAYEAMPDREKLYG